MADRMDVKAWRKSRNGKAYTIRIGSTWTDQKGLMRIELDALPLPDAEGRVSMFLEEPRERDAPSSKPDTSSKSDDLDRDGIPF
jgi:hypothetical protein